MSYVNFSDDFYSRLRKMRYPQFITLWENLCQLQHQLAFQISLQQDQARTGFLINISGNYEFYFTGVSKTGYKWHRD